MTAATLVGLMSIPALAVLYGGLVQKKWAMNTVLMVFSTFCLVLITWVLWAFKMGFGTPLVHTFLGDPRSVLGHAAEQGQANIPLLNGLMPNFRFPQSSLVYFQFVFAAITPILFIGSVLGRIGFNGGDPYFAGADAAAAVLNTNLATAVAMMTWIIMDMAFSSEKKPTFLGGLNGMICGLVGITPAAGYVNGFGAIVIGLACSAIVWAAWYYLPKYVWPFNKVDDALGVVYTHGFAGLFGGLLTGLLADPNMIVYLGLGKNPSISGVGLFYGHPKQLALHAGAALTIIVWDAVVTFILLKGIGLFVK